MSPDHKPRKIGILGLGAMGLPMAKQLVTSGYAVFAYDPFPPQVQTGQGIELVQRATDLALRTDTVICIVSTPQQANAALLGDDGLFRALAGGTVIVMATIGPEAIRELDEAARASGVKLIDAPVSGGVVRAGEGTLLIMTSSRPADRDDADEVLAALGNPVKVVGDAPGDGQVVKLVNQLLCGVHIAAAAEALALATRLGVAAADAWDTVRHGAAASFMLDDRGQRMIDEDFDVARSAVDIFVKDMALVTAAARAHGMNPILAQSAQQVYLDASEAGLGRKDDSSIITRYLRQADPAEGV